MKTKELILVMIILIVLAVVIILSPFSPLNKATVDGETFKIPSGYTIQESETIQTLSNGTNTIQIYKTSDKADLEEATNTFKNKFNETYNTTISDVNMNSKRSVKKTVSTKESDGKTVTTTKIWFIKNNKVFNIQYENDETKLEQTAKDIISSMN